MEQKQKPLFVIDPNPTVDWPVIVKLPADGGTFEEYQFTAKIRVLSSADYAALLKPVADPSAEVAPVVDAPSMSEILADQARKLGTLVVGWDDVFDVTGLPVPFTSDALVAQIVGPRGSELASGLWMAITEIRRGERLKNSVPPSVAG